ncbi:MAG TPA: S4 domain-containing protein, partial [Candidatus Acidoferrum sp.]|nr:S4 domain-containing protein [Candidatus Acidoferrum sp.]
MATDSSLQVRRFIISQEESGARLDRVVAAHCPEISRTRVQELMEEGLALLNGKAAKGSHKAHAGDVVEVVAQERPALRADAEDIPLKIL